MPELRHTAVGKNLFENFFLLSCDTKEIDEAVL
jgi:hypothetical protein